VIELTAELHCAASARPGQVVKHTGAALSGSSGGERAKADVRDAADVDQSASLRRTANHGKVPGIALNGAKAQLVEKFAGENGSELDTTAVLVIDVAGATIDDAESTAVVWLMIDD
jgi:hypothetical protein